MSLPIMLEAALETELVLLGDQMTYRGPDCKGLWISHMAVLDIGLQTAVNISQLAEGCYIFFWGK